MIARILLGLIVVAAWISSYESVSSQTPDEVKSRLNKLARAHALATQLELRSLGVMCYQYTKSNETFPGKPSDLRPFLTDQKWTLLFATYDAELVREGMKKESNPDELWDWIDSQSSFRFNAIANNPAIDTNKEAINLPIIVEEKAPVFDGMKLAVHLGGGVTFELIESYPKMAEQ